MTYRGTPPTINVAGYAGFVNGDTSASLTTGAHVLDHGHELEPGLRLPVRFVVLGGGRLELRHHLQQRHGDSQPGSPQGHRLERLDDLRRHAAHGHRQLSGFENGDGPSSLSGTLVCVGRGANSSQARCGLGAAGPVVDSNYTIDYVDGTTTVGTATLTITPASTAR